jgi:hypothetical protein
MRFADIYFVAGGVVAGWFLRAWFWPHVPRVFRRGSRPVAGSRMVRRFRRRKGSHRER